MTQRDREYTKHTHLSFQKHLHHSKEGTIRIPTHAKIEVIEDLKRT